MATVQALRAEPSKFRFALDDIGGGRVIRPFSVGGKKIMAGTMVTAEFIKSINPANRESLLGKFIAVWPKPSEVGVASRTADGGGQPGADRHIVAVGFGRYDVYERKLNSKPLSKAEAEELTGAVDETKPKRKRRAG